MTPLALKAVVTNLEASIEALEKAIAKAQPEPPDMIIINDPEEGLEAFRIPNLDMTQCIEIGPPVQLDEGR
jgi:hypothetical protein